MSNPPMYGNLVPLDRTQHAKLKLSTEKSALDRINGLNSLFLAVAEFADACKEFPVVFVRVGAAAEGQRQAIAPLAVFGLKQGSNLFVKDGQWTARYLPAYVRRYPFAMARMDDGENMVLCMDSGWDGLSDTTGAPLFDDKGEASQLLLNAKNFCEEFEREADRTRQACEILQELNLLQDMRFEATLPNGEKLDVDGFMTINEKALAELSDAKVVELHRNGLLELITMHRLSLGHMSRLASQYQAQN
ncbi:SapC family protein [Roseateles sp. SL47]|jgi:SapC|uniref:SapC family protein n=1 Tax=Roseateles sp. SL47 TaxID=2995138 RepID=UPI0022706F2B|nr:SapC family protein [Roseateles sp. SL47]WAC72671.1 SapC family protein [Roseateles sp. SL47]